MGNWRFSLPTCTFPTSFHEIVSVLSPHESVRPIEPRSKTMIWLTTNNVLLYELAKPKPETPFYLATVRCDVLLTYGTPIMSRSLSTSKSGHIHPYIRS